MHNKILIIDDEEGICVSLTYLLKDKYTVFSSTSADEGLELLRNESIQVMLLDLRIGEVNGIEVLKTALTIESSLQVIIMTAYGSISSSVEAMKNGAFTYVAKPLDTEELLIHIKQSLDYQKLNEKVSYLSEELENISGYGDMLGNSSAMQEVYSLIEKVKDLDTCITITGESGTGKELAARAIHYQGKRKSERFIAVNCAAIPDGLLESEFFGHKRGSFTGAVSGVKGKLESADGGTLFLDEIGDMPFSLQSKLLRVIQEKEFSPIGSTEVKSIDVRIIAASNRELKTMMDEGTFRKDLYYRLSVVELKLPPLRERKSDIPLLSKYFIEHYNEEIGKSIKGLTKRAEEVLLSYNFPGNIRELSNILEYAVIVCDEDMIDESEVPYHSNRHKDKIVNENIVREYLSEMTIEEFQKQTILAVIEKHSGTQKEIAKRLGISERGLRNKLQEYEVQGKMD